MAIIESGRVFCLIFLCTLLSLAGCRLGNGFSLGPEGSLFGIPVEIGHSQPQQQPHHEQPSLFSQPRAGHVSQSANASKETQPIPSEPHLLKSSETKIANHPIQSSIQQVGYEKPIENPPTRASQETTAQLSEKAWIKDIHSTGKWQWNNPKMDELLLLPVGFRPDFEEILQTSSDPLICANAAIVLAQEGKTAPESLGQPLLSAIHSQLPTNVRSAALEAYVALESTSVSDLDEIFDIYYEKMDGEKVNLGKPELVMELLCHLPKKKPFCADPCYVAPLTSRKPQLRQRALELWRDHAANAPDDLTPPDSVLACCHDRSPQIRAIAMETLARWQHPETITILEQGLRDSNAVVRGAAIHGLGILNTEESMAMLTPLLKNHSRHLRASAAKAFYEAGQLEQLFRMTDDEAYEVRCAVASGIAKAENAQGVMIAKKYMSDPSPDVQEAMLKAVSHWNPEQAFPIYLEMLNAREGRSRRASYEHLTRLWPEIKEYKFESHEMPEKRQAIIAKIKQVFETELRPQLLTQRQNRQDKPTSHANSQTLKQSSDQTRHQVAALLQEYQKTSVPMENAKIENQLIELGPECLEIIESLALTESYPIPESLIFAVLPNFDVSFEHLDKLRSDEIATRRLAASSLTAEANYRMLSPLIYACLEYQIVTEHDEIVQLRLWELVGKQAKSDFGSSGDQDLFWQFAGRLTLHSLSQESPELRRRACEYLKDYGHPSDAELLIKELMNPKPSVIRSAIQAMASLDGREYVDLLRPHLNDPQPTVAIDAALALHRLGEPIGTDTLQRLAHSRDRGVRTAIVQGIRQTNDPSLIPILVQMLDNAGSLRAEILNTLPKLAGREIAPPQELARMSVEDQIHRWKAFQM